MASLHSSDVILKLLNVTQEEMDSFIFNISILWKTDEIPFTDDLAVIENNHSDTNSCECGAPTWLRDGAHYYTQNIHGVAALCVCLLGALANILNLVVLTRRELRVAPVNCILCCLALADVLVMLEYIPFVYELHLDPQRATRKFLYPWALFFLGHMHFAQVLHTTSIMLTLLLASWRCLTLAQFSPTSPNRDCSRSLSARRSGRVTRCLQSKQALSIVLIGCVLLPLILCTPSFFCFTIQEVKHYVPPHPPKTLYLIGISDLAHRNDRALYHFHFWFYAVLVKLLPCVLLTALSGCLIRALMRAQKHSQRLLKKPAESIPMMTIQTSVTNGASAISTPRSVRAARRTDRTTRMLVAVTLLFLVTELPQGVLGVLSGIYGPCFFLTCYQLLGDMLDMLALLNGAVNFILYCAMSRQFRATFCRIFMPEPCVKCSQNNPRITVNPPGTGEIQVDNLGNTAVHVVNSDNYSNV